MECSILLKIYHDGSLQEILLTQTVMLIGRIAGNDIVLDDSYVSKRHARLEWIEGHMLITDLRSFNGTYLNNSRLEPLVPRVFSSGDSLRIGSFLLEWTVPPSSATVSFSTAEAIESMTSPAAKRTVLRELSLQGKKEIALGRQEQNTVILSHPSVSRFHARIQRSGEGEAFTLEDLQSTNGTFLNGKRIDGSRPLHAGDVVHIGTFKLSITTDSLQALDESAGLGLEAWNLTRYVKKNKNLLQDISLRIAPNEFVALVGASGCGKSTLMAALKGTSPATSGKVWINGTDLYANYDAYRTQLGFVPQEDIIHRELTVLESLDYAARLRLPADTDPEHRRQRIREVLGILGLQEHQETQVAKLSGGQRKRVSLGVELLTKPGLFFLDEATSGLDPGTEADLMQLLRGLSDQGHTVILITHATKNVMLCDKVAFLAPRGHLAYYGPPQEALSYFEVPEFDAIYRRIENELSPEEWDRRYRQSKDYRLYAGCAGPAPEREKPSPGEKAPTVPKGVGAAHRRVSSLHQFLTLSARNLRILFRDRVTLVLTLLVPFLVGSFDILLWKPTIFDLRGSTFQIALIALYFSIVNCFLTGSIGSLRTFVREADIYRRERMVTLRIFPYVFSKIWVSVLLCLYQASIFLLFKMGTAGWPKGAEAILQVYFTLFLAILGGVMLGLLTSAVSANQNVAPLLLVSLMVVVLTFAGMVPGLGTQGFSKQIGRMTVSKYAFESMVTISEIGKALALDPCWQLPEEERDRLTEEEKLEKCTCMGPKLFHHVKVPGILDYYHPAVEAPEPEQPGKPAAAPAQPAMPKRPTGLIAPAEARRYQDEMKQWEDEMQSFRSRVEQYQKDIDLYQSRIDEWQKAYQSWKSERSKAIGSAEAILKQFHINYRQTFHVDLANHWLRIGVILLLSVALLVLLLRLKDPL